MLLALTLAALSSGNVYVVDSTGAGDFVQLAEAVDFAADGDTIVVRPWAAGGTGRYDPATIQDKDLRILAEKADEPPEIEWMTVRDLAAQRQVVVSGLRVGEFGFLAVNTCSGPVRIAGFAGPCGLAGCHDVVLSDCSIDGGLTAIGSQVAVYDCSIKGWHGGGSGGPALFLDASVAWLAGVIGKGGNGTDDCDYGDCNDGGDGIEMRNGSVAWATDCTFSGGGPGYCGPAFGCESESGAYGEDEDVDASSTLEHRVEPRRSLALAPVTGRTGSVVLEAVGVPGERVFLIRSPRSAWRLRLDLGGVDHTWHPPASSGIPRGAVPQLFAGVISNDGSLSFETQGPVLHEHYQAVFVGPAGLVQLGDLLGLSAAPAD